MNILGAQESMFAAPAKSSADRWPKLDPRIVAREHIDDGRRTVVAMIPGGQGFYRITPDEWSLLQLFDGSRSYEEVAKFASQSGLHYTPDNVREFADAMDGTDFFYRSPAEKNRAIMETLVQTRGRRRKRNIDLTDIVIYTWNARPYFDWLHPKVKFIYTRWFTFATLALFAASAFAFVDHWGELWSDSIQYYNFTQKGFTDLLEFWIFFGVVVFFHESAHGLTCTHWRATVHRMGFTLMYFMPTFYCDVSEAWLHARKWERIAIMFAGCWIEMVMCAIAGLVWWGTAPGMAIHELAYKIMLVAGLAIIILNLNPLIKLDGYYIFCDLLGVQDVKEKSTAYLSNWLRHVFRLPVQVQPVKRRRKWFYITYAILSGAYSYVLLFIVVHWTFNISHSFTPEWAFLPALLVALYVFRTPLKRLGAFMNTVYLDKKEVLKQHVTPTRIAVAAICLILLLIAPIWRDTIEGRFVMDAPGRAIIRAEVAGRVMEIAPVEAQFVTAGTPVVRLRNLTLESQAALVAAQLQEATSAATRAQLVYSGFGPAERDRQRLREQSLSLAQQSSKMEIAAPVSGTVVSTRPQDLVGTYVQPGTPLLEIAPQNTMRVRIYVAEPFMHEVRAGALVAILVDGTTSVQKASVESLSPSSQAPAKDLLDETDYRGMALPEFFIANVTLQNPGWLREGMSGTAKILVARRSVVGFTIEALRNAMSRRIW